MMIYNKMGIFDIISNWRTQIVSYDDEYSMKSRVERIEFERANIHILPARRVCLIVHANPHTLMPFHQHLQYFDEL